MTRPFQWGIVGTGGIARQFAADLALLPEQRWPASVRATSRRPRHSSRRFGAERAYADLDAMLAIRASTRSTSRRPTRCMPSRRCARSPHGKAVLVEKPLATSVADAERIASEAASRKCFAMEGMWTRFLPAVRAAKKLVDDGAIGKIRRIGAELSYRRDEDGESRFFRPDLGGGAALDLGVYPVSLALHFLGKPLEISGALASVEKRRRHAQRIQPRIRRRREAHLSCGFDRDGGNQFVIEGSEGVLRLEAPFLKAQRLVRFHAEGLCDDAEGCGQRDHRQDRAPAAVAGPPRPSAFRFPATACSSRRRRSWRRCGAARRAAEIMPLADSIEVAAHHRGGAGAEARRQIRSNQNVL